jgi:uncharacterized membrane protein
MKPRAFLVVFLLAAAAGLLFSGLSTYDFVQHLDRQLHGIHCSFIPGLGSLDATGSSGCSAALMSPYSSVLRRSVWGGIPISLGGMTVFAFLVFQGLALLYRRLQFGPQATKLLFLLTLVPVLTSVLMGTIAATELGSFCKVCVGIYVASFVASAAALVGWRTAVAQHRRRSLDQEPPVQADEQEESTPPGTDADEGWTRDLYPRQVQPAYLAAAALLGLFVLVPTLAYLLLVPDSSGYVGSCGRLQKSEDPYGVMVPMDDNTGGASIIEVLDPLCPACRGFERRFQASGLAEGAHRQALLFPLDSTCNWMIDSELHPGACVVSEAVLCAGDRAREVVAWAFEEQEAIRTAATEDPKGALRMVRERFPEFGSCVGSSKARSRLNRSLRWAVSNQLPLLMPQVFVNGVKLCDEDTDLGLEYTLSRLLDADFTLPAEEEASR